MPSATRAGSSGRPFSSTECTVRATRSMNVEQPGVLLEKLTTVSDRKVCSPLVRSSCTSYVDTAM